MNGQKLSRLINLTEKQMAEKGVLPIFIVEPEIF